MSDNQTLGNFDSLAALATELNKPAYIGEFSWPANVVRVTDSADDKSYSTGTVEAGLAKRTQLFEAWYDKAWQNKDTIAGMLSWQLSGLEWGNGNGTPGSCQWCSGPYGEYSGGWTANNDGFQFYCVMNSSELSITGVGAPGNNVEGDGIRLDLHEPVCELIHTYSDMYKQASGM